MKIIAIKTMASRYDNFRNIFLPNIVNLSKEFNFDKVCVTIDDNNTNEDIQKFKELETLFDNVEILIRPSSFNVVNKLAGPIEKYGYDNLIISLDDDLYYKSIYIKDLLKYHELYPNDVVCIESNPTSINQYGGIDIKIAVNLPSKICTMRGYFKFLSGCTLYPNKCFEGTRLFDEKWIVEHDFNRHDELFYWAELGSKGIKTCSTNTTFSIEGDDERNIKYNDSLSYYDVPRWQQYSYMVSCNYPKLVEYVKNNKNEFVGSEEYMNLKSWRVLL